MSESYTVTSPHEQRGEFARSLLRKRRLVLTVDVCTEEAADELMVWMHGPAGKRPMKADLLAIGWDCHTVSRETFEALQKLKNTL